MRTRFLAAVRNPALRKVTMTMVKHEAVESLCLEIFITYQDESFGQADLNLRLSLL